MLVSILERVLITLVSFNLRLSFFLSTFLSLAIPIYYRSLLFPKYHTVASLGLILIIVYYSSLLTSFEVEKIGFKYKCNNSQVDYDHYEDSRFEPRPIENIVYEKGQWKNEKSNFLFHGINLPAKTPYFPANLRNTNSSRNFYKHTTSENKPVVSFVGKPFPLDLADEHFRRLSNYGFNLIRLTVTWEAVMHKGPGIVDNEYLDYLSELVDKASNFGLYALIDPHQDVWSRFTGGDGAPFWTLDAVGFKTDDSSIHDTGCAILHQHSPYFPKMMWTTNYGRLATATMFTLFFAGDVYAPGATISDSTGFKTLNYTSRSSQGVVTIQFFLQKYYLQFISSVAKKLKNKSNVLGFNTMNEPSNGFVGFKDLKKRTMPIPFGHKLSAFEGMRLASGDRLTDIEFYKAPFKFQERVTLNEERRTVWKSSKHDVWRNEGIYEIDAQTGERILLKPDHFAFEGDFIEIFMKPFYEKVQRVVSEQNKKFIVYAEPHIDLFAPAVPNAPDLDVNKFGWSPHWYDMATLFLNNYLRWFSFDVTYKLPLITPFLINLVFKYSLKKVKNSGNGLHVIIGETGVPFDITSSKFINGLTPSEKALDRTLQAAEKNNMEYVIWNYFHENSHEHGDMWNQENLSIRADNSNRGLQSAIRPHIIKYSRGLDILHQAFDPTLKHYKLKVGYVKESSHHSNTHELVLIYLPSFHFSSEPVIKTAGNSEVILDYKHQLVKWKVTSCPNYTSCILDIKMAAI